MIKTTVLSAPALTQVSIAAPVAAVSLVAPVINLQYPFPIVSWLLDVRGLHARYEDQVGISDAHSALVEKAEFDQVGFSDAQLYALALGKVDAISFLDQFDRVCSFFRNFPETVGISDTQSISLDKPLANGITLSDQAIRTTSKGISDGVVFGDSQFTKSLSPKYQETVQFSDSFFLNGNSYCDFTYFAEDYVGAVRQI